MKITSLAGTAGISWSESLRWASLCARNLRRSLSAWLKSVALRWVERPDWIRYWRRSVSPSSEATEAVESRLESLDPDLTWEAAMSAAGGSAALLLILLTEVTNDEDKLRGNLLSRICFSLIFVCVATTAWRKDLNCNLSSC